MDKLYLSAYDGFLWDAGNKAKNWEKHKVSINEIEDVFVNLPLFFFDDLEHSLAEQRTLVLGKTSGSRLLSIIFTVRYNKIRVISARDMSRMERKTYEENTEKNSAL